MTDIAQQQPIAQKRSAKSKKVVSEMKAADSSRGSANSDTSKLVFRYMSLLKALRAISTAQGLKCVPKPEEPIHWSKDAVVLIGTALEKRLREILASALKVVAFGGKQTVTERAIVFAASMNKDCAGVFIVPNEAQQAQQSDDIQTSIDHVISPAAVHRISAQVGIQRMSQRRIVKTLRQASRFFLFNVISGIKDLIALNPRSTVGTRMVAVVLGNWASLVGFKTDRKSSSSKPAAPVVSASAPAPTPVDVNASAEVVEVKQEEPVPEVTMAVDPIPQPAVAVEEQPPAMQVSN